MEYLTGEVVIFDTEYTAWEGSMARGWSGPGEYRELIQIAAIKVDVGRDFAEVETLDVLVCPIRNPILSAYVSDLTGITQRHIEADGLPVDSALRMLGNFCGETRACSYGRDDIVLQENRSLNAPSTPAHPGPFSDLRPGLAKVGVSVEDRSSGTLHKAVGLSMDGHVHNALFDVRSIIACLRVLREIGRI